MAAAARRPGLQRDGSGGSRATGLVGCRQVEGAGDAGGGGGAAGGHLLQVEPVPGLPVVVGILPRLTRTRTGAGGLLQLGLMYAGPGRGWSAAAAAP